MGKITDQNGIEVALGGEVFRIKCTGTSLAKLEDMYGTSFTDAIAQLCVSIESRSFKLDRLAKVFAALIIGPNQISGEEVLRLIQHSNDTISMAEGIGRAITAHFPTPEPVKGAGNEAAENPIGAKL